MQFLEKGAVLTHNSKITCLGHVLTLISYVLILSNGPKVYLISLRIKNDEYVKSKVAFRQGTYESTSFAEFDFD